jgi:hypothetical protein
MPGFYREADKMGAAIVPNALPRRIGGCVGGRQAGFAAMSAAVLFMQFHIEFASF